MNKDKMTYVDMIAQMYKMQNEFNKVVHPSWQTQDFSFHTAIVTEVAEGIDSFSWKWWKKGLDNYQNYVVELVDLWHFVMSQDMQDVLVDECLFGEYFENGVDDWRPYVYDCYSDILKKNSFDSSSKSCLEALDTIMQIQYEQRTGEATTIDVCYALLNTWTKTVGEIDLLYKSYIGKNALNGFRQENGYRTGTYKKLWNNGQVEDNVVMMEIIAGMQPSTDMYDKVYEKLQSAYDN